MCKNYQEKGNCEFEDICNFAHGEEELRPIDPKQPVGKKVFFLFSFCLYSYFIFFGCCFICWWCDSSNCLFSLFLAPRFLPNSLLRFLRCPSRWLSL